MTRLLPMLDPFDEIRRLYFATTRETIERDIARATELLTRMASDAERERVAGYMHGLADLRREWKPKSGGTQRAKARPATRGSRPVVAGKAPPPGRPKGRG
jgi:hypothetical protein